LLQRIKVIFEPLEHFQLFLPQTRFALQNVESVVGRVVERVIR
jgi:hypothetical protein